MIQHELPKVPRRFLIQPFASHGPREWWYSWARDPESGRGFSVFFYRMSALDTARITFFDPRAGVAESLDWKGWLASPEGSETLHLQSGAGMLLRRDGERGWSFRLGRKGWSVAMDIAQEMRGLVSTESKGRAEYGTLQTFGCRFEGSVRSPRGELRLDGALGYFEHSWGVLPRHAKWRWLQGQNEHTRIVAMQGLRFQSFCRLHTGAPDECWLHLDPRPVFQETDSGKVPGRWLVASDDLDLEVDVLQESLLREAIPPLVPFCVDLRHRECPARIRGRARIRGGWRDVGELHGTMELHDGTW